MPHYLMTYRGPKGYAPSPDTVPLWRAWFDSMGDQLVDIGRPVQNAASVGSCGPETTELDGYSIVEADDLDSAIQLAKGCPHLEWAGGVEVGILIDLSSAS